MGFLSRLFGVEKRDATAMAVPDPYLLPYLPLLTIHLASGALGITAVADALRTAKMVVSCRRPPHPRLPAPRWSPP